LIAVPVEGVPVAGKVGGEGQKTTVNELDQGLVVAGDGLGSVALGQPEQPIEVRMNFHQDPLAALPQVGKRKKSGMGRNVGQKLGRL
jgi:hypothetical protein